MSHLVAAEEQANPLNGDQLARFASFVQAMPGAPASLANSSGIFLGPDYHFDMLRPGAALYGINPLPGQPNPMLSTVRLDVRILQTRAIDALQTVGYGAAWRSARPSRVATIALGYADGYFRNLINRAHVHIAGQRVPVIGRISMDLVTIDVTDVPGKPGAYRAVVFLKPHFQLNELSVSMRLVAELPPPAA